MHIRCLANLRLLLRLYRNWMESHDNYVSYILAVSQGATKETCSSWKWLIHLTEFLSDVRNHIAELVTHLAITLSCSWQWTKAYKFCQDWILLQASKCSSYMCLYKILYMLLMHRSLPASQAFPDLSMLLFLSKYHVKCIVKSYDHTFEYFQRITFYRKWSIACIRQGSNEKHKRLQTICTNSNCNEKHI